MAAPSDKHVCRHVSFTMEKLLTSLKVSSVVENAKFLTKRCASGSGSSSSSSSTSSAGCFDSLKRATHQTSEYRWPIAWKSELGDGYLGFRRWVLQNFPVLFENLHRSPLKIQRQMMKLKC